MSSQYRKPTPPPPPKTAQVPAAAAAEGDQQEQGVRINGFQQILEMLRVADPAFRESLLKRIALRDRNLAFSLRRDLGEE